MAVKDFIAKERIMSVRQNLEKDIKEYDKLVFPTDEVDIIDTLKAFDEKPKVAYTITFSAANATTPPDPLTMQAVGFKYPNVVDPTPPAKLTEFPVDPIRTGYIFNGWFTADSEGTQITLDTVYTADTTVYAQWTAE